MVDLNLLVVLSFVVLAVVSVFLVIVLVPIALQLTRTLGSAQHLLDTVNDDLGPTVKEIKLSVNEVKDVLQKGTSKCKQGFNRVKVSLLSCAYGLVCGVKEYLSDSEISETSYNGNRNVNKVEK